MTVVRLAISVLFVLFGFLGSPSNQSGDRVKRTPNPPWLRPSNDLAYGPPGHRRPVYNNLADETIQDDNVNRIDPETPVGRAHPGQGSWHPPGWSLGRTREKPIGRPNPSNGNGYPGASEENGNRVKRKPEPEPEPARQSGSAYGADPPTYGGSAYGIRSRAGTDETERTSSYGESAYSRPVSRSSYSRQTLPVYGSRNTDIELPVYGAPRRSNAYSPDNEESDDSPNEPTLETTTTPRTARRCKKSEFHCGSGECVPKTARCDSYSDCEDSSDEDNCDSTSNRMGESEHGCVLPPRPEGGRYRLGGCDSPCLKHPGDKVPQYSMLNYTCRENYTLSGNAISICVNDEWFNPPSCLKTCPPLSSSTVDITCNYQGNAANCSERARPGTLASLQCKKSYKLPIANDPAYREVTCLEDGLWDRQVFRCLPECGTTISHGSTLVVNGYDAQLGFFPWHVGIYEKVTPTEFRQICGGSLISNNLVVSAAHCFYDDAYNRRLDAAKFAVAGGKYYREWDAIEDYVQKSEVAKIVIRQRYLGLRGNFAEDIAIVKLATPFQLTSLVRPVCMDWDNALEREQLQSGISGKTAGWGKTITGQSSTSLQALNMPFVSYSECITAVPRDFQGYITPDKFCAGYENGSTLCKGDSGGGLCFKKNDIWYLRGIVSVSPTHGEGCEFDSYVGFTYVSHFRDWIRSWYLKE